MKKFANRAGWTDSELDLLWRDNENNGITPIRQAARPVVGYDVLRTATNMLADRSVPLAERALSTLLYLARVEYYLADVLSVLETGRIAEGPDAGFTLGEINLHNRDSGPGGAKFHGPLHRWRRRCGRCWTGPARRTVPASPGVSQGAAHVAAGHRHRPHELLVIYLTSRRMACPVRGMLSRRTGPGAPVATGEATG